MEKKAPPTCFLFDNGSLQAASVRQLRRVAASLQAALGVEVEAVSLLHSSGIAPAQLDGLPARLLEPALSDFLSRDPQGAAVLLPLFFGPSAALTEYLPTRLASLTAKYPAARLRLADSLVRVEEMDTDMRVAQALADAARRTIAAHRLAPPRVVLVDHGSPQRAVTRVRDRLGEQVRSLLGTEIMELAVASMERRPGVEFDFNEPLLARRLREPPFEHGDVVVLLQFLSPGRHAGPDGDIARICAEARGEKPELRTVMTEPIATDPRVIAVLAQRYAEAVQTSFLGSIKPTSSA